jgi:hypothetical protein
MNLREQLVKLLEAYAAARGLSLARVSTIVFNHGTMHQRLVDGSDITVGRLESAVLWLSTNWPEGVDWPDGIARPVPEPSSPEAA